MTFPREGKFNSSQFFASKDVMGWYSFVLVPFGCLQVSGVKMYSKTLGSWFWWLCFVTFASYPCSKGIYKPCFPNSGSR